MSEEMNKVEKEKQEVQDTIKSLADSMIAMQENMEQIMKEKEQMNKAMIDSNEEEKIKGANYTFIHAAKDVAEGKIAKQPYWDRKTEARFSDWLHMVKENDYNAIKKAFGDNVTDAANWIPDEFVSQLVRLQYVNSMMLPKVNIVPMSRDKLSMPTQSGDYTVGFASRGGDMVDSNVTHGLMDLETAKIYALAIINNEDLSDAAYPLATFVAQKMGEDFAKFIDKIILYGDADGSANAWDGEFNGLANAADVKTVQGAVNASPTWADVWTLDNILDAVGNLDERALDGGEWFISPMGWNHIRGLQGKVYDGSSKSDSGVPLIPMTSNYFAPLLGFPVNVSSRVTNTVANDAAMGFFGNPKHIYVGDRMAMNIATSQHYRFANDQVVYRGTQRLAVNVAIGEAFSKVIAPSAA